MEDGYGMGDLRHYIDGRPLFPAISQPPDLLSCHRGSYPYDMLIFRPTTADSTALAPSDGGVVVGFEAEAGGMGGGGDGGAGRWPRQETLTLLEIRSRLNLKFKEANQKSPLWDEVARIMWQEHGYQRSGKKCREKFENLYKYYKKTKEGKAGRQDGKHYRFFRQLEALYGEAATTTTSAAATHFHHAPNYNFPNSSTDQEPYPPLSTSECDTTTSSYCTDSNIDADDARLKKKKGKMRRKIEASIEAQMRSMTEKQEEWMERMTRAIEEKEQERLMREEQWRRQDAARIDGEHKMWAAEKAWIESRDAALMDAFTKLAGREIEADPHRRPPPPPPLWPENDAAWDEACGGGMCREKWDHVIGDYLIKCSKKRKDDQINRDPIVDLSDHGGVNLAGVLHGNGNLQRNGGGNVSDAGPFRYFIGDSYQRL